MLSLKEFRKSKIDFSIKIKGGERVWVGQTTNTPAGGGDEETDTRTTIYDSYTNEVLRDYYTWADNTTTNA